MSTGQIEIDVTLNTSELEAAIAGLNDTLNNLSLAGLESLKVELSNVQASTETTKGSMSGLVDATSSLNTAFAIVVNTVSQLPGDKLKEGFVALGNAFKSTDNEGKALTGSMRVMNDAMASLTVMGLASSFLQIASTVKPLQGHMEGLTKVVQVVVATFVGFKTVQNVMMGVSTAMAAFKATQSSITTAMAYATVGINAQTMATLGLSQTQIVQGTVLAALKAGNIQAAVSTSGLTAMQVLQTAMTGVQTGAMTVATAVTYVFKKAIDALNRSFLTNPVFLLIAGIAALVAIIVSALNQTTVATEQIKAETEELTAANEELINSSAKSAVEHQRNMAGMAAEMESARALAAELGNLKAAGDDTTASQERMALLSGELAEKVPALSSLVNESTGVLRGNEAEWNALIDAQSELGQSVTMIERYREVATEASGAIAEMGANALQREAQEARLTEISERRAEIDQELIDIERARMEGMAATSEGAAELAQQQKSLNEEADGLRLEETALNKSNKELEKSYKELSKTAKEFIKDRDAQAEAAKYQAKEVVAAYDEQITGMTDFSHISKQFSEQQMQDIRASVDFLIASGETVDEVFLNNLTAMESAYSRERTLEQDRITAMQDGRMQVEKMQGDSLEVRRRNGEELTEMEQATLDRWTEIQLEAIAEGNVAWEEAEISRIENKIATNQHLTEVEQAYIDKWNEMQAEQLEKLRGYQEEAVGRNTDFFSQYQESTALGADEIQRRLEEWGTKSNEFYANMAILTESGLHEGVIAKLYEAGPEAAAEAAGLVAQMEEGSFDGWASLNESWESSAQAAVDGANQQFEFEKGREGMLDYFTGAMGAVAESAGVWIEGLGTTAVGASEAMTQVINAEAGSQIVTEYMGAMGEAVNVMGPEVRQALHDVVASMVEIANETANSPVWVNVGHSIVAGMAQGIRAGVGMVRAALQWVIDEAVKAATKKAEVNSPSKLFARALGIPISEGIAYGIDEGAPEMETSLLGRMIMMSQNAEKLGIPENFTASITNNIGRNAQVASTVAAVQQHAETAALTAKVDAMARNIGRLVDKDWGISVDGRQLALATNRANANLGYRVAKGPLADVY